MEEQDYHELWLEEKESEDTMVIAERRCRNDIEASVLGAFK